MKGIATLSIQMKLVDVLPNQNNGLDNFLILDLQKSCWHWDEFCENKRKTKREEIKFQDFI